MPTMIGTPNGGSPVPVLRSASGERLCRLVMDRTRDRELAHSVHVVSQVLPFKVSSYVIDELIDWNRVPDDPMYRLTFPHRDMLDPRHFELVDRTSASGNRKGLHQVVNAIRDELNPHPGDQLTRNIPRSDEVDGWGLQHKYRATLLVFPRQGQTCHSYCGYCFRWAQFVDRPDLKLAVSGPKAMTAYLDRHPEITDVLITGGDPLVMRTKLLADYLLPLLDPARQHIETIRIGTKAVSFWPYRLLYGPDSDDLLQLFTRVVTAGKHLAMMLHLSHPVELTTDTACRAVSRLASTGVMLRAQAPVVRYVNDDPLVWAQLWQAEVRRGIMPYYMFVERDTGARRYFGLPIIRALEIYRGAIQEVCGLGRTARGPVMSTSPGKIAVDGVLDSQDGPAFALRYLQARKPELVGKPFLAAYDSHAQWWDQLRPFSQHDRAYFDHS